jgi:hypothetical protein
MPIEFLTTRLSFQIRSRSVQLAAICDGVLMDIIIPRAVLELIAGAQRLSQDESFTAVVQNLTVLRAAASRAAARRGAHVPIIAIDPADIAPDDPPLQLLVRLALHSDYTGG